MMNARNRLRIVFRTSYRLTKSSFTSFIGYSLWRSEISSCSGLPHNFSAVKMCSSRQGLESSIALSAETISLGYHLEQILGQRARSKSSAESDTSEWSCKPSKRRNSVNTS